MEYMGWETCDFSLSVAGDLPDSAPKLLGRKEISVVWELKEDLRVSHPYDRYVATGQNES